MQFWQNSELYSGPCQTSKMEYFTKLVIGFQPLTIFAKSSILGVEQGSQSVSETIQRKSV